MPTKLFVGGLAWATTNDSLRDLFAQAGTVVSATVITDKFTGKSKGFGFVEMSSADEANKAVEMLNGKDLDGRAINVSQARPQQPREPGSFGGGRSFDRSSGPRRDDRGGNRGGGYR